MLRGGADEVGMRKIKGVEVWFLRGSVSQGRGVGGAVLVLWRGGGPVLGVVVGVGSVA